MSNLFDRMSATTTTTLPPVNAATNDNFSTPTKHLNTSHHAGFSAPPSNGFSNTSHHAGFSVPPSNNFSTPSKRNAISSPSPKYTNGSNGAKSQPNIKDFFKPIPRTPPATTTADTAPSTLESNIITPVKIDCAAVHAQVIVISDDDSDDDVCLIENDVIMKEEPISSDGAGKSPLHDVDRKTDDSGFDDHPWNTSHLTDNANRTATAPTTRRRLLQNMNSMYNITPGSSFEDLFPASERSTVSEISADLTRMLEEKKKRDEIKRMEKKLMEHLKGDRRFSDSDDSDDDDSTLPAMNESSQMISVMKSFDFKSADCMSLDRNHEPERLFSWDKLNSIFCQHSIQAPPGSKRNFSSYPCMQRRQSIGQSVQTGQQHFEFLLRALCVTRNKGQATLIKRQLLSGRHEITSTAVFDEVFVNFGVCDRVIKLSDRTKATNKCSKCKAHFRPDYFASLGPVLEVFSFVYKSHQNLVSDKQLIQTIAFICLLLTLKHGHLKPIALKALEGLFPSIEHWSDVRVGATEALLNLNTVRKPLALLQIVMQLPNNCGRCVQFQKTVAFAFLYRCLYPSNDIDDITDRLTTIDIQDTVKLISNITSLPRNPYPGESNRTLYVRIWFCVMLTQICVGNGSVNKLNKSALLSVFDTLNDLNTCIRDNGLLYCSEVKHYLKLVTTRIDFQLQHLISQSTQQNTIFKYLYEPRVNEELITEEDIDTVEDEGIE